MADIAGLGFVPENVEDVGDGFSLHPPGVYTVVIVADELRENNNKTGHVLEFNYQFVEGPMAGETIKDYLNILHQKPGVQKRGQSDLKQICTAVGHVGQVMNTEVLHGKPFSIKLGIEDQDKINPDTGKPYQRNTVKKRMVKEPQVLQPMPEQPAAAHGVGAVGAGVAGAVVPPASTGGAAAGVGAPGAAVAPTGGVGQQSQQAAGGQQAMPWGAQG